MPNLQQYATIGYTICWTPYVSIYTRFSSLYLKAPPHTQDAFITGEDLLSLTELLPFRFKKPFVLKALQSFSLCNLNAPTHIQDSFICWKSYLDHVQTFCHLNLKTFCALSWGRPAPISLHPQTTLVKANPQIRGHPREQGSYFTWGRSTHGDLPQFWGRNLGLPRWGLLAFS